MLSSSKFLKDFDGKAHLNVPDVLDVCLELPSESTKHLGFVVDEFFELVHIMKITMFTTLNYLLFDP